MVTALRAAEVRLDVRRQLREMDSPCRVVDDWEAYDAAICPVCFVVFPPFPPGILCPNCSWWRALKARRSRMLLPVAYHWHT